MKNHLILLSLVFSIVYPQGFTEVRIKYLDSVDDAKDFQTVMNILKPDFKEPIRSIEYHMFGNTPADGDWIIYYPQDKDCSPLIERISTSTSRIIGMNKTESDKRVDRKSVV